ncbi:hypothetical protein B0H13DRAFT_1939807 [Mycena leptocephala]|nr:hypothetical protein B0H13DRAFT_1939807 [Mycena leptocephala]
MVSPQFVVFHRPGFTEYRVENWRLARDGSGRVLIGVSTWKWWYSLLPLAVSLIHDNALALVGLFFILTCLLYFKCTQTGLLAYLNLYVKSLLLFSLPTGFS